MLTLVVCSVCHDSHNVCDYGRVCAKCTARIARDLVELPRLLSAAVTLTTPSVHPRPAWRYVGADLGCANRTPVLRWHSLPSGPARQASRIRISGSRTAPLPVSVELLNLVGPGSACVSDPHGDQTGELPVHCWLGEVAEDWASMLGHTAPRGTVSTLVEWLVVRLDMVCARHEGMAQFADELGRQVGILRFAAGVVPPRPELCKGVACRRCDTLSLWRYAGRVSCATCGTILEQDEYAEWTRELAKVLRRAVTV